MHTTEIGKTIFIHNGDFSGNITIKDSEVKEREVTIPFKDLVGIIAAAKRNDLISNIEQLDDVDIINYTFSTKTRV